MNEEVFTSPMAMFIAKVILYFTILYLLYTINKERNEILCEKLTFIENELDDYKEISIAQTLCIKQLKQDLNDLKNILQMNECKNNKEEDVDDDYEEEPNNHFNS